MIILVISIYLFRWRGTFCSWALPMLQILVQKLLLKYLVQILGKTLEKTFAWILSSNVGAVLVQILFVLMTICWLVSQVAPVLLLDINNSNNNNNNDNNNNDNNNNSIYLLLSQVALVLSLDPPLTWLYLKFSIRWFYWLIDSFNFEYISRFTAFFRTLVLSLDWLLPHGWLLPSQWCFSTSY